MTQNIYDDEDFFREYSLLPRSVAGLDAAPEWPALRALLPDLDGLTVVDLGCGFGWFCRWVREQGAASVLGIDTSEKMLARAIAATGDPAMTYTRADMEWLELPFALVARWCSGSKVETAGGVFQVREDEPTPRVPAGLHRTP